MDLVTCSLAILVPLTLSGSASGAHLDVEKALDHWQPLIVEAARRFAIPAPWIREVMRAESGGQATIGGHLTRSSAGAMGLMQIMPATYADLRARYGLGDDPYDPRDNIRAGAAYLRELYERYGWPSLLAAYHAGSGRFDDYLSTGRSLPAATRDYLAALVPEVTTIGARQGPATDAASIFVPLARKDRAPESLSPSLPDDRLFVRLRTPGGDTLAVDVGHRRVSPKAADAALR